MHQREYKILEKGFANGLSKYQISNIFKNQDQIGMNPLELIDSYVNQGGVVNSSIKANFYNDCSAVPDPTELNSREKNLLILDDCLLEKQSKAESYYTRGRHNNCDTFYISQNYFRLPRQTRMLISSCCSHKTRKIWCIFMLIIVQILTSKNLKNFVKVFGVNNMILLQSILQVINTMANTEKI